MTQLLKFSKNPAIAIGTISIAVIAVVTTTFLQTRKNVVLEAQEISQKAQKFTVRIDGEETGTGVIINRQGNTYKILTCWHVVDTPGKYQIITPDNRKYDIVYNQIKKLKTQTKVDLAVIEFTSNQNYTAAEIGDSQQITSGTTIYYAGYPDPFPGVPERRYYFSDSQVNTRLTKSEDGYEILYRNAGTLGTSGGPILDSSGRVVGINGKTASDGNTGQVFGRGIPVQFYVETKNTLKLPTYVKTLQDYFNDGERKLKEKDYKGAIREFSKTLDNNHNDFEAYYKRGNSYYKRGNAYFGLKEYQKAIADYNEAIRLNSQDSDAYYNRGLAYYYLKEYQKAIVDYDEAIHLNPQDADAYVGRGNTYNILKEYQKAIADYTKAIRVDPNYVLAYYNRGDIYNIVKEYQKMVADYNKAIQLNPKFIGAYIGRGNAYGNLKEYQKAIADYNKAIRLNPNYANAYYNRGIVYKILKKNQKAYNDLQKSADLDRQQGNTKYYQDTINRLKELK